jgi:hypothetical protein
MSFNSQAIKAFLKKGEIKKLFIEGLGWDAGQAAKDCEVQGTTYSLKVVASKAGFKVWHCELPGQNLPSRDEMKTVHRQLVKESYEHIIIFSSKDSKSQAWLWVRREANKPISYKHHLFNVSQEGESLTQKLRALYITFEEEESGVNIVDVTKRAKTAFDVEKVTKKFYQEFDKHRKVFLGFIDGIPVESDREWYASVMLNRLMFAYFIQKKGFLDSNPDYLKLKLKECQAKKGEDKFYSFYRIFLLRLFHEGLGMKKLNRPKGLEALLGNIPYLNGGMFDVHELEQPEKYGRTIEIKDEAFEKVFAYFDQYQWHLDERPLKNDKEINPDVLGYIFEKYINQKQMGAYYTKEDITEYISKSTIIPFIFDSAKALYPGPFEPINSPVWSVLKTEPEEFIYKALKHGVEHNLPASIEAGINVVAQDLMKRRAGWNKAAPGEFGLPTETWREVVERRQRYAEIKKILLSGEVSSIDNLVSLNLDIRQFALEVIDGSEDPELIWSIWKSVTKITVLDPTGGSGAFLFAALNILEPIYEACLEKISAFSAAQGDFGRARDFEEVLVSVKIHTNRKYFILKSIILNNLYAVDIMEEAVEICKLRLFLKLASHVEPDGTKDNFGIEPLPDIDFNIRSGNALVGYATAADVNAAFSHLLDFEGVMPRITSLAREAQELSDEFRRKQLSQDADKISVLKASLLDKLAELSENLDQSLAAESGVAANNKVSYNGWKQTARPFHWYTQYFGIMSTGGFDVVIGNPPYVEYSKKKGGSSVRDAYEVRGFKTKAADNLYAFTMERSLSLGSSTGRSGMIVPVSFVSGENYATLVEMMCKSAIWLSSYSNRPAKLFDGVEQRLTIYLKTARPGNILSAPYIHWYSQERETLFEELTYQKAERIGAGGFPSKTGKPQEREVLLKMTKALGRLANLEDRGSYGVWYHDAPTYWIRCLPFEPNIGIKSSKSNHYHRIPAKTQEMANVLCAILNSSIFYFHFKLISNCRDFGPKELKSFCVPELTPSDIKKLSDLGAVLGLSLKKNAVRAKREYESGSVEYEEYFPQLSKCTIDEVDEVLGGCYGFTPEDLDFVINYDIKYRLGRGEEAEVDPV